MNPYAYVGGNPETRTDPTGHCWPWCTGILGAIVGAVVGVAVTTVQSVVTTGHLPSAGEVLQAAASGAVSGAIIGITGPGVGVLSAIGIGVLSGAAGGATGQVVSNALAGKGWGHLADRVLQASLEGALIGGISGGLLKGGSFLLNRLAGQGLQGSAATLVDAIRYLSTRVGDFTGLAGSDFEDVTNRIPSSATQGIWRDSSDIPDGGYKWRWGSNPVTRLEIHGSDLNAPFGSNANQGWILRVSMSHRYLGADGIWWSDNVFSPTSLSYNPAAWNSTHIPVNGPR